jgi:dihydroorotase
MKKYDLLIRGGMVVDPVTNSICREDVALANGQIALRQCGIQEDEAETIWDADDCYVVPGLIDMHCHVYPIFPWPSVDSLHMIDAENIMFRCGVTTAVDAGSCGWRNFGDFMDNVVRTATLRILAFVDIAARGMSYPPSEQSVREINPRIAAEVAKEYTDTVVGFKSAHYWPRHEDAMHPTWASIDGAMEAADLSGKIVMVDSIPIVPERSYSDILNHLAPGDIHTHVFAQQFPLMDNEGRMKPYILENRARGVKFDVGHGTASFWFRQAVGCFKQGFWPDTISTDLHRSNLNGPTIELLYVMSKFLAMGMPLEQVIAKTTLIPARELKRSDLGTLDVGACADVAVLRVRKGHFGYMDCGGARMTGEGKLECVGTIRAGRVVYDPEARSMPEWTEAPAAYWTAPALMRSWNLIRKVSE